MDISTGIPVIERSETYADLVFEQLKTRITHNQLAPGTVLKANEIAAQLNISISPVRDAILRLETCGWVRQRGKNKVVYLPEIDELRDYLVIRVSLEQLASRLARSSFSPGWEAEIKEILDMARYSHAKNDSAEFISRSTKFHLFLAEKSGNKAIIGLLSNICEQMLHANLMVFQADPQRRAGALDEHIRLSELMLEQRWDEYEAELSSHIGKWPDIVSSVSALNADRGV